MSLQWSKLYIIYSGILKSYPESLRRTTYPSETAGRLTEPLTYSSDRDTAGASVEVQRFCKYFIVRPAVLVTG